MKEDDVMIDENTVVIDASEVDPNLLRILDRGIDDIEADRTLSHEEAIQEVSRIRGARRNERANRGEAVNA